MKTLTSAISEYMWHCQYERNLSFLTQKAYRIDLRQFQESVGRSKFVFRIDKEDIRAYIKKLFDSKFLEISIRRKLASLKGFFKYLEYGELIKVNPMWGLGIHIRLPRRLPKTISLSDIQSLIIQARKGSRIKQNNKTGKCLSGHRIRDKFNKFQQIVVIELLFGTGMRVNELCSLNVTDLDLTLKTVKVFGKGSKERILHITHQDVLDSLHYFLMLRNQMCSDSNALFLNRLNRRLQPYSIRLILGGFAKLAQLSTKITPHIIRHTTATLMLENGIDIRFVQKVLGHSSISTTQWYTHISLNAERKILEEKHPRNLIYFKQRN